MVCCDVCSGKEELGGVISRYGEVVEERERENLHSSCQLSFHPDTTLARSLFPSKIDYHAIRHDVGRHSAVQKQTRGSALPVRLSEAEACPSIDHGQREKHFYITCCGKDWRPRWTTTCTL